MSLTVQPKMSVPEGLSADNKTSSNHVSQVNDGNNTLAKAGVDVKAAGSATLQKGQKDITNGTGNQDAFNKFVKQNEPNKTSNPITKALGTLIGKTESEDSSGNLNATLAYKKDENNGDISGNLNATLAYKKDENNGNNSGNLNATLANDEKEDDKLIADGKYGMFGKNPFGNSKNESVTSDVNVYGGYTNSSGQTTNVTSTGGNTFTGGGGGGGTSSSGGTSSGGF